MGRRGVVPFISGVALIFAPVGPARAAPDGYQTTSVRALAEGVTHLVLEGSEQTINVARIRRDAPVVLRPVLANDSLEGRPRLERTSSMCARVRCIAAVNGDFFSPEGVPLSVLAIGDEPVRSPSRRHHQFSITSAGKPVAGPVKWRAKLVATDLREIRISTINMNRAADALVLYTPWYGARTRTNRFGVELVIRPAHGPIRINDTAVVRLVSLKRAGNSKIPADGAVLSGHGDAARALEDLWHAASTGTVSREALLRVSSDPDVTDSIGGRPVLVRDGKRVFSNDANAFVRARHPRTLVGWTAKGDTMLVTVDGRQPGRSAGMSLREAADLMIGLGAVHAVNLDGGGSTTFVSRGSVINRPSDVLVEDDGVQKIAAVASMGDRVIAHAERPVAVALAVVPRARAHGSEEPLVARAPAVPAPAPMSSTRMVDPASDPTGALPGLIALAPVTTPGDERMLGIMLAFASVVANVALWVAVAGRRRGRRIRST